jgi:hypothetical protein
MLHGGRGGSLPAPAVAIAPRIARMKANRAIDSYCAAARPPFNPALVPDSCAAGHVVHPLVQNAGIGYAAEVQQKDEVGHARPFAYPLAAERKERTDDPKEG